MTWQESLEIVVSATRHDRYRWLTSEDNPDVAQREGYRRIVIAKASASAGGPIGAGTLKMIMGSRPSVAESVSLTRKMKACPYRSNHPPCGCQGGRCGLRKGSIVSHVDCFACIQAYVN